MSLYGIALPSDYAVREKLGWHSRAACRDVEDPEIFFPIGNPRAVEEQAEPARKICRACPVRGVCLSWALEHSVDGIWGGTTEYQRRALNRR